MLRLGEVTLVQRRQRRDQMEDSLDHNLLLKLQPLSWQRQVETDALLAEQRQSWRKAPHSIMQA
jgi:hypothetical protein